MEEIAFSLDISTIFSFFSLILTVSWTKGHRFFSVSPIFFLVVVKKSFFRFALTTQNGNRKMQDSFRKLIQMANHFLNTSQTHTHTHCKRCPGITLYKCKSIKSNLKCHLVVNVQKLFAFESGKPLMFGTSRRRRFFNRDFEIEIVIWYFELLRNVPKGVYRFCNINLVNKHWIQPLNMISFPFSCLV